MKLPTTLSKVLFGMTVAATLFSVACSGGGDGKIPYDEARAENEVIPIWKAKQLQKHFLGERTELGKMVKEKDSSFIKKHFRLPNAETFGADAIKLLLNQGADSIRIYYGIDTTGEFHLVLLPVDKSGKDIIKKLISHKSAAIHIPGISSAQAQSGIPGDDGDAVETGQICPPCMINEPPPTNNNE